MAIRTGKRKFGGKSYDFFMFKDTKAEAESAVRAFKRREREQFKREGLARITKGINPWFTRGKPRARNRYRYLIWVRVK